MSELDSRVEKSISRAFYEIEYDEKTHRPTNVRMVILAAVKDTKPDRRLEKGEHVAFTFNYGFSKYGEVERFEIPKTVAKIIK